MINKAKDLPDPSPKFATISEDAMDDKQKIEKMIKEGTITPEQAELLLHAVKESERRRQSVLGDIKAQKKSRKNKARGILGFSLFIALALISICSTFCLWSIAFFLLCGYLLTGPAIL